MYIINDICYAGEKEKAIKVSKVKILPGGMLLVTFSTGEARIFDASALRGSAFEPLKDEKVLSSFGIFHGILTWKNGEIDIAPETLYDMSYPYTTIDNQY